MLNTMVTVFQHDNVAELLELDGSSTGWSCCTDWAKIWPMGVIEGAEHDGGVVSA